MKKFTVKIDLSTFFQDERKFVIILVDPQWKNVEFLQHRVEEIFDVRPVHFLTKDNLFIPPQESIEIVEFAESLKAFIPKHAVEESRRRSKNYNPEVKGSKDYTSNVEDLPCTEKTIKKRKYHTLGTEILSSSTPNQSKKSRRTPIPFQNSLAPSAISAPNESQEITSTNDQSHTLKCSDVQPPKNDDDKPSTSKTSLNRYTEILENKYTKDEVEGRDSLKKKKRKRVRSKNSKEITEKNASSITIGPEIPSSTLLSNSKSVDKNSHIFFNDLTIVETKHSEHTANQTRSATTHEQKLSPKIIFKCKLNERDVEKPLVFPLKVINKLNRSQKQLIIIKENILLPPANLENIIKGNSKQAKKPVSAEIESEICTKNVYAKSVEEKNNIDSITSETITNNNSESLKENNKNEPNATETLEDSNVLENTKKDIGKDFKEDTIEKRPYSENGNIINSEDEMPKIPTDRNESSSKEKDDANTTKADPSDDECSLDKNQNEAEHSKSGNKEDELAPENNVTEDLESSSVFDESCVIDLDDDDEDVINLSDADEPSKTSAIDHSSKLSETLNKSISTMSIEEMLPFCTKLNGSPKVGDVIVFKFNRKVMGKKDVSEFIACKCDHVNRRTKLLKLEIINATKEKNIIPHQYAYNLDESFVSDKFMNIRVSELIDPKVLEA